MKKSKLLLVVLFNGILTVVLLEFALSIIMHPLPTYAIRHNYPNDKVEATAGVVSATWTSNALGFHDRDHERGKLKGTTRILAVGDSFLDGPQSVPMPKHLENELEKKVPNVDVVNLSRPGVDPDSYAYMVDFGLKEFKPDIVVVSIYQGNDFRGMERFVEPSTSTKVFARYPEKSIFSRLLPRTSIFASDIRKNTFIHKFKDTPLHTRWGRPVPVKDLTRTSVEIAKYIEAKPDEIETFLKKKLTPAEIEELTSYGVRLDLLSYMVGVGMDVKFTPRLSIKNKRPELNSADVAEEQVIGVTNLLKQMEKNAKNKGAEFYVVFIPTSDIDPVSANLFKRLGSYDDPLFAGVRKPQMDSLQNALKAQRTHVTDLAEGLADVENTYLIFDTHWTEQGAELSAKLIAQDLLEISASLNSKP